LISVGKDVLKEVLGGCYFDTHNGAIVFSVVPPPPNNKRVSGFGR